MSRIVFLLEEPSAKEALNGLLPRVLGDLRWLLIPHEGKQNLMKSIPRKLRAWQAPGDRFVVIRDQDGSDCLEVKNKLVAICKAAGRPAALVRLACRELESWFLGDLAAVEKGTDTKNLASLQMKTKYRDPDRLANPSSELKRLVPRYQKLSGARAIGRHLDLDANTSRSFRVLVKGLRRLALEMGRSPAGGQAAGP